MNKPVWTSCGAWRRPWFVLFRVNGQLFNGTIPFPPTRKQNSHIQAHIRSDPRKSTHSHSPPHHQILPRPNTEKHSHSPTTASRRQLKQPRLYSGEYFSYHVSRFMFLTTPSERIEIEFGRN